MILNNELIYNNLKKHNNRLFENLEKISELINIDKLTISNI